MTDQLSRLASALADRYRIDREIGRGGMATVYLAEDLKHRRKVALKVLLPELAATLGSERFLQEIRVTANLQHPHILPLYDSGRTGGWADGRMDGQAVRGSSEAAEYQTAQPPDRPTAYLYYVMPYIEGESLRDRLKREKQLPIEDALRLTEQIASALDFAHRHDVVHRDIKPENILLQEDVPLMADFGIALAVSAAGGERLTETGLSVGTPAYMSPEQAAGDRELDARSDVYSLACVLYEMLAGDPPFTASTAQAVLARHVTDPAPPITTVRSSVPASAAAALNKALAKAPADRFQSAKAFAEGLFAKASAAEPETKSIAVLPFANLSPDPENEYFADGLTEEITTDLSQIRSLMVISRNSAMQLKSTSKDTKTIGRELGVRYVLEGTVRKAGNRLRITAQLIDTETDAHLWASKFNGTLDDVFELQESVSRSIVDALQVELSPAERRKIAEHAASGSVEAYDLYLLGRHHMNRLTKEGLQTAVDHFQRAVELQPDFAKAYAGLADSYMLLTQGSGEPPLENFPKARTATLKALEIDPQLEEAHTSLGGIHLFFDWDWDGAERELRRAIELNPNYGQAHHWLAISFNARGRHSEALEAMKRALALDPLSPYVNLNVGWIHYAARDFDSALTHLLNATQTHPDSPGVRGVLGVVYAAKGMFDQAIVELETAGAAAGQGFIMWLPMLGYTLARAGRVADARKLLRDMEDMEQHQFVNPDYFTIIHIGLGEHDKALDRLEQATHARTDWPLWFSVDPMVDPIRAQPRFVALLERIGLSELAVLPPTVGVGIVTAVEPAPHEGPHAATPLPAVEPLFDAIHADSRYHDLVRRMDFPEESSARAVSDAGAPAVPSRRSAVTASEPKTIVVLPFENVSPDPENAFFADGLTEELIADLSRVQALRVISRTSAFAFKDTSQTVPTIARELSVRYALEGSVRRAGNNLRITAQLIDTETDAHLWAEKYSGTLDDVFDLQEQLSRQIVHELEIQLTTDEHRRLAARPLDDVQAHDIWLRARQSALTMTREGLDQARQLVEDALALVGDNALLHATMGWVLMVHFSSMVEGADEAIELAKHHAAKAMELNPDLAWAHFVTGGVHHRQGHIQEFLNHVRGGLAIERDSHFLSVLGLYLPEMGRVAAARRYAEEARARDPLSWMPRVAVAYPEIFDGRAETILDDLRAAWKRFAYNEPWSTYILGFAALRAGQEDEAMERFRHVANSDNPLYSALSQLFTAALQGDRELILEVLSVPSVRLLLRKYGVTCAPVASCLAHVGEKTQALEWLEAAIELGYTNHRFIGVHDHLLAPLRGEPRFQALLGRAREKEQALVI